MRFVLKRPYLSIAIAIVLAVSAYYVIKLIVPAELKPGKYTTDTVDRGAVIQTIEASGVVEPLNESYIYSPASSTIQTIIKEPGSKVNAGETILLLDQTPVKEEIENLEDRLEMRRNNLQKTILSARSTRLDLEYDVETKKLQIASIKSELADQKQLLEVGGISTARLEQTKQELVSAQKNLEMIQEKNHIRLKQLEAEEEGLKLQIESQEKELESKKELLEKMRISAPSTGIVLNIYKKEGEKVKEDELLVIISDLTSFKIIGSLDESQADYVKTGKPVYAVIDNERLSGRIGNIKPVIENNKIQFDVYLDNSSHPKLIPNLQINLLVVRQKRDNVLRLKKGPAIGKGQSHTVYIIDDNKAYLREIKSGLKGDDFVEITSGVSPGEKLITSDVSSFRRANEIDIK